MGKRFAMTRRSLQSYLALCKYMWCLLVCTVILSDILMYFNSSMCYIIVFLLLCITPTLFSLVRLNNSRNDLAFMFIYFWLQYMSCHTFQTVEHSMIDENKVRLCIVLRPVYNDYNFASQSLKHLGRNLSNSEPNSCWRLD